MDTIRNLSVTKVRPIKVVQFGEGNFLRAFVDYYISEMNDINNFNGNIAIVKSIKEGALDNFIAQNNLYTVLLRGKYKNKIYDEAKIIDNISVAVDLHTDYNSYIKLSENPELKFIVSNTTEAGIVFNSNDSINNNYNITYPAKLTKFLYNRFLKFNGTSESGLHIIPCELIDNNATELQKCVDQYIDLWRLPISFRNWNNNCNYYCNSLVDRIVTGYPKSNKEEIFNRLGYIDELVTIAEPFGLWVIENKGELDKKLNVSGLDKIIFVNDVKDYKTRKVRLLNGAHTSLVPVAYLSGISTVGEAMASPVMSEYVKKTLFNEIIPTVPLSLSELTEFANAVIERFENPFVMHMLLSIALNSISKWRVRVLPSMAEYYNKFKKLPRNIVFSLACLIKMYGSGRMNNGVFQCNTYGRNYELKDDLSVLKFFDSLYGVSNEEKAKTVLSNIDFWGEDLDNYIGLQSTIVEMLDKLDFCKAEEVIDLVKKYNE